MIDSSLKCPILNAAELEEALARHLHNIRTFQEVASAGTIATAARRLNRASSAVTRSIQELELAVRLNLAERTVRGILPTTHGQLVLTRAERISEELQKAASELVRGRGKSGSRPSRAFMEFLFNGRRLKLLIHLVEAGTISAAAELCGLTQSGASMALSRVENALGLQLFRRAKHGLVPNERAKRLILRARRAMSELRHLAAELCDWDGALRGTVVLGTSPLGRTHILPMALASNLDRHPEVCVMLVESPLDQLLASLRAGLIDAVVGVARGEVESAGLDVEALVLDRMAVMARKGHPLAMKKLSVNDLLAARWLLPWPHSPSRRLFDSGMRSLGVVPPPSSVETADLAVIRQLLLASDLIGLVSHRQMRFELQSGLLIELDTPLPPLTRDVGLIVRKHAMLSPAARAMLMAIRQEVVDEGPDDD